MPETISFDLTRLGSELALIATILAVIAGDLLLRAHPERRAALVCLAVFGLLLAAWVAPGVPEAEGTAGAIFSGMLAHDGFSIFFKWLFLVAAFLGVAFGALSDEIPKSRYGEYLILLLCLTLGLMLLASAQNLLMIFVAIELVSLPSYILTAFRRGDKRTSEAALKYVIYGAGASGLMLYGFSLIYGLTGTLALSEVGPGLVAAADGSLPAQVTVAIAALLSIVGLCFKVAAVPFHMWCPDVYEGGPTPFVAFLSVAPKAAGMAALLRFVVVGYGFQDGLFAVGAFPWQVIIALMAIATMTIGNLAALPQSNVKRLLAYSSIAHAGYLLMGVAVGTPDAMRAVMLYLPIYLLMNMGAFLAVMAVRARTGSESITAYRGLGSTSPFLAVALAIFLFSLVGIPPFAGFIAKFYLLLAVLKTGMPFFYFLAVVAVVNTAISLFYYARIARAMFLEQPAEEVRPWRVDPASAGILAALAVPTLALGVFWAPLAGFVERTAALLGAF